MSDFYRFITAVGSHWVALVSGGVVVVIVGIVERLWRKQFSPKLYALIMALSFFASTFLAWQGQYRKVQNLNAENEELSTLLLKGKSLVDDLKLKLQTTPKPIEVRIPKAVQPRPEPPIMEGIRYTQERTSSPRAEFPYAQKVVIQTDTVIQPTALLIECDGEVGDAVWGFSGGGVRMKIMSGVVPRQTNVYFLKFEFPPFAPQNPLIVTLFSKDAIRVKNIKRTMFTFP